MKGDFSRRIFDANKHYAGVLHQQGRVWLDSDWNDDVSERLDLIREETTDVVGVCGVPEPGAAFLIQPNPNATTPGDFLIGGGPGNLGRAYVNGVLCRMESPTTYLTQPDLLAPPAITMPTDESDLGGVVYLEVWQRLITALEDDTLREVALGGPDTTARLKTIAQVRVAAIPQSSAGLVTCANAAQFLPQPGGGTLTTLQPQVPLPTDLCRLPDPNNYTGRQNHLYRVEIHEGGDPTDSTSNFISVPLVQNAAAGATTLFLAQTQALTPPQIDAVTRWGVITVTDNTGLSEKASIASIANDGQSIALAQGLTNAFTTANNAVVHGVARFKWSRDNASFAVRVTAVSADRLTLTLSSLGRDQATAPPQSPPTSPVPAVDRHLIIRRWDGQGVAQVAFSETGTPDMDLGDGVQIQFGGVNLLPGDYWQFVARSTDGSIEALTNAPPAGIVRRRSPLAVVRWSFHAPGSPPTSPPSSPPGYSLIRIEDCRQVFPPLVDLPRTEAGLHIQQVVTVNQQSGQTSPLINDSPVPVSTIASGINVVCDASVDPASVKPPTCFLSVEIPGPVFQESPATSPLAGYTPVIVASSVTAVANTITWLPSQAATDWLAQILLNNTGGILARFTLKGNYIWTLTTPPLFLDGEAYGFNQSGTTSLGLPSGDRRRGGDFEMWFWLIARPVGLQPPIMLSQASIFAGGTVTGTINLTAPATAGLSVGLMSSAPSLATVPATLPINVGFTSTSFTVTAPTPGPPTATNVTITATLSHLPPPSSPPLAGSLTVTLVVEPPLLSNMQIIPPAIPQGTSATGLINLSNVSPPGTVIALSSSNPSVAAVPPSIVAGGLTVTFPVTTGLSGQVTITATSGNSVTANATVIKTAKEIVKEGKETVVDKTRIVEKIIIEQVANPRIPSSSSGFFAAEELNGDGQVASGRAFIRSEERPVIAPPG
jgi:hypothetical protein